MQNNNSRQRTLVAEQRALVLDSGGFVSDHLKLDIFRGEMGLKIKRDLEPETPLLFVPEQCMPRPADFELIFDGSELSAAPLVDGDATDLQIRFMQSMVALYSVTGKIFTYSKNSPYTALLPWQQLLALLDSSCSVQLYPDYQNKAAYDLQSSVFFGSRTYTGYDDQRERIMPLIDFADHNIAAPGYVQCPSDNFPASGVEIRSHGIIGGAGRDCLVSYLYMDRLECFLRYGFYDESPGFMRSVPVSIELSDGYSFVINARPLHGSSLPIEAKDFADGVMQFFTSKYLLHEKSIETGYALIPNEKHITYLSRSIAFHLSALEIHLGAEQGELCRPENVCLIEDHIVTANKNFYKNVVDTIKQLEPDRAVPAVDMLYRVVKKHLEYLKTFEILVKRLRES